MNRRIARSLFVASVVLAGCQGGAEPPEPEPGTGPSPAASRGLVGPEVRLVSALDRAHFAFRADRASFRARHSTHAVSVRQGIAEITPYHHGDGAIVEGATIALETRDVRRGAEAVPTALRATRVDATTGHLVLDRGAIVEELENFEDGVEQRWRLSAAPAGTGDLTVRIAVDGHPFVAESAHGLHFLTAGRLGFRYGNATWIDAAGAATAIKSRWEGDHIAITVPEHVLVASAYPAVLDPVVNAEIAVDNPVIGWTGAVSTRSAIASSGTDHLVVWSDARNGSQNDIFGTRLTAAGAVVDTLGISVSEDTLLQDNVAVAFAGDYVVIWDDTTNVGAARVTTGGAVTALGSIGAGTLPKIVGRGSDALAVFVTATEVRAARYSGGAFGAAFTVASGVTATTPAVAANPGGDYLVTWSEGATAANLRGQFVTAAGTLSGAAFDISAGAGGQNDCDLAWNGSDFVAVWSNNNAGVDIYGTRVTVAGVALDTHIESMVAIGGKVISAAAGTQLQATVACGSGPCLAAWSDRRAITTLQNDVYAQRLDASFTAIGGEIAVAAIGNEQRHPAAVAVGSDWRLVWHDRRHGGTDVVFSARVNADGSLPDGTGASIVTGNNRQLRPTIASSTNNWLVGWSDSRVLGSDLMAVRFNSNGVKQDFNALTVSGATGQQGNPGAAFNGTDYLVVWNDTRNGIEQDIFGARVAVGGTVLDAGGISISTAAGDQQRPVVASGGGVSLVAWQDGRAGFEIYGAIVNGAGAVTVADIPICAGPGAQLDPAVAFDTTNNVFLVTWNDNRTGTDDVYGARVTTAGTVLDACGLAISTAANSQSASRVTFGGNQFLVTWTDTRTDAAGDIYGARVTAAGSLTVLDAAGLAIATGAAAQTEPDVAFVQPNINFVSYTRDGDIYGQSVLGTGSLDGPAFVVSANPEAESSSAVTAGPDGKPAMVAYERVRPDLDTVRVATRRVSFSGTGGSSCSMDSACSSGFCVDGYCCDQACGGNDTTDCQACSVQQGSTANGVCSVILNTTHTCRYYATPFCDRLEKCDGITPACPPDLGRRQGVVCNACSDVCPANDITGAPHLCPACP